MTLRHLPFVFLLLWLPLPTDAVWLLAEQQQARSSILVSEDASPPEQWAAQELQLFVRRWSLAQLPIMNEAGPGTTIVLGTPENQPLIADAHRKGILQLPDSLGEEGYEILTHEQHIFVAARTPAGVLYGTYAILEKVLAHLTGLTPVDLDFAVPVVDAIFLSSTHLLEWPFYPVRSTLETEDPDWLSRHRINMSGAEGVWTGTGSDDGLGTAFKYVDAERFASYQDETATQRRIRIAELQRRFALLAQRGIRPYLFMYVTGEPTKALIQNHPELLAERVSYGGSRNLSFYYPLCWRNPNVHALVADLVQEIVRTYPNLGGLHLRSWGWETRAPDSSECAGDDNQDQLWKLHETITDAALEIRPDFRFYLSGYDRSWLKDPEGARLKTLPNGTIISRKWGSDGEPTPDPGIALIHLHRFADAGAQLLILSHDTEEVMPFWMLEGDLFVQGVRKYAFQSAFAGLGGFTLQGQEAGLSPLDKILSARLTWDPQLDYESLLLNYLTTHFGREAAPHILQALRLNSWSLASLFRDYAYALSVTGAYGNGSAGAATRFWQLVGPVPLQDMLSIPDVATAEKSVQRFSGLLPQQLAAVNEIVLAEQLARPSSAEDKIALDDTVTLMRIWLSLFESRLNIAEALALGFKGARVSEVEQRLDSAREYSRTLRSHIGRVQHFVRVFGYQEDYYRLSLTEELDGEIELLATFDAEELISPNGTSGIHLEVHEVLNYPNPLDAAGTTFFYELTYCAETVTLRIYAPSGKRIWESHDLPTDRGDNQFFWDARDLAGEQVANGAYLYRLTAVSGDEESEFRGKLAVLR